MTNTFIERQLENSLKGVLGNRAVRVVRAISKMAAKQGGESAIENYQMLGKRALVVVGVIAVAVQVTASTVGYVISRRREEQRIEQIVHRVLEEERQKDETEA